MLDVITYASMLENIKESRVEKDTIGILFARPTTETGKGISDSLPYYHYRTGHNLNFYLPGYGAYLNSEGFDIVDVTKIDNVQWSFSNKKFTDFIYDVENNSKWEYSGESELLLIGYKNNMLDYSNVLNFKLDAMLRDQAIPSINYFFEYIFRETSKRKNIVTIGDRSALRALGQVTIENVLEILPKILSDTILKERHYIVWNYSQV